MTRGTRAILYYRLRLSKGSRYKSSPRVWDFIVVNYAKPKFREIDEISEVKAVWNGEEYEIHVVHKSHITEETLGDKVDGETGSPHL